MSIYYLLAKFGFDTAENEPCKVCPLSAYRSRRYYLPMCTLSAAILSSIPNLQDWGFARFLVRNRGETEEYGALKQDFRVWCLAFLATLCFGVLKGIAAAVFLSICHLIISVVEPRVLALCKVDTVPGAAGWREKSLWSSWPHKRSRASFRLVPDGHTPMLRRTLS